jgi:hypothetical protein
MSLPGGEEDKKRMSHLKVAEDGAIERILKARACDEARAGDEEDMDEVEEDAEELGGVRETPLRGIWMGPGTAMHWTAGALKRRGITHVVNLARPPVGTHWFLVSSGSLNRYLTHDDELLEVCAKVQHWIEWVRASGSANQILIQCQDGASSSAAVVLYLMMEAANLSVHSALAILGAFHRRLRLAPSTLKILKDWSVRAVPKRDWFFNQQPLPAHLEPCRGLLAWIASKHPLK